MQEAKRNLRLQVKEKLSNLKKEEKKQLDFQITERLNDYLSSCVILSKNQSATLGIYYPLDDEVSWHEGFAYKKQLAFPKVEESEMTFRHCQIEDLKSLRSFGRKMRSPGPEHEIVTPEIMIVPGIAFDRSGNRLGRGGGYYDSYLRTFQGPKIGICYDLQLVDELPTEDHDVKVDTVLTGLTLIELNSSKEEK